MREDQLQRLAMLQGGNDQLVADELQPKIDRLAASGDRSPSTVAWLKRAKGIVKENESARGDMDDFDPFLVERAQRKQRRQQLIQAYRKSGNAA